MSALLAHIGDIIRKRGPISVAEYMELALQHPEFGYYRNGDPLGSAGDFVTAPEISQMFGEMIGLWCADVWRQMGKPEKFVLLELGPGRGTLLQDALRATAKIHGFHEGMSLCLIESNATLRGMQEEKLVAHKPRYIEDVAGVPDMPLIAVANEFFDALPMRQFEKGFHGWCERTVGIADNALSFVLTPLDEAFATLVIPRELNEMRPGAMYEVSLAALLLMRSLTKQVARQGGAALIIDYGYVVPPGKPTLQAVAGHERTEVLDRPGEVDITAHVDFATLKSVVEANGALPLGPIGQGEFLQTLGIELRADQLKRNAAEGQRMDIDTALKRLTDVSEMGSLFKAMAVAGPGLSLLPGF